MVFNVKFLSVAEKDLEDILDYYDGINHNLVERFHQEISELIALLRHNPFFEVKYDLIRVYKLKSFPYTTHFYIDEISGSVIIIAVAFGKQLKTDFRERI